MNQIESFTGLNQEDFDLLISKEIPFIIRHGNFGKCLNVWDVEYLCEKLQQKTVIIHQAQNPLLNFLDKNFKYQQFKFDEFLRKCRHDDGISYYYLRSTGNDKRGKEIANLMKHFPEIASDVEYPDFLNICSNSDDEHLSNCPIGKHLFSNILRISSKNLTVWTHYDVLDNILLQVKGRKRVILFPPNDANFLYLRGDKSEILNLDDEDLYDKYPLFKQASKHECILEEGDALFIPSMWFHNTKALDFSIGINFFWKISELFDFYDKTDAYGNKDLIPAKHAYCNLDQALKHLSKLPDKYRKFYIQMIISKLNKEM